MAAVTAAELLVCAPDAHADDMVAEVRLVATRIQAMLTAARRASDAIRVTCLDDKLTRAHAAVSAARGARTARQQRALRERARQIAAEAEACTGGPPVRGTSREVAIDPAIPAGDPTDMWEGSASVDRPPSASGYY